MLSHLSRKVSRKKNIHRCNCRGGVEERSKDTRREARSIHQLLRSYRGSRNFLDRSTNYRGSIEIAIRKSLEVRQIARCQGSVEEVSSQLLKKYFEKRKMQTLMQSSTQLNQGSNQQFKLSKSSLNNNFKHIDPKNTHTLNKSNQFYISKIS